MRRGRPQVLIDARLLAYRRGGISRYVSELLEWLPQVAPELRFSPIFNRSIELPSRGVRVFTPPHHRLERTTLGVELSLRRPQLVHSPDFIVPRTFGSKSVATVHDLNFITHPEQLTPESLRYYRLLPASLQTTDHIIAVSHYTSCQLQGLLHVDQRQITVIPNGVDLQAGAPADPQTLRDLVDAFGQPVGDLITSNRPMILMVGTIEPRKRHQLLLDAMRLLTVPDAILVVVGQAGWMCGQIVENIQSASQTGDVIWLSDIGDAALSTLYAAATLVVVPSLDEGFGLPLLEGMAAGAPVVAAERGALPEIGGDAALLIAEDDPESWADALAALINDDGKRKEMSEMGLERARQFTWERTARMTADAYRQVISS